MKKALLATAGFAAATIPIFSGLATERLRAQTQTSAANRPAFAAVSIKPNDGADPGVELIFNQAAAW